MLANHRDDDIRSIGDQPIDSPFQQAPGIFSAIHGPDLDAKSPVVRGFNEAARDDASRACELRDLKAGVTRPMFFRLRRRPSPLG